MKPKKETAMNNRQGTRSKQKAEGTSGKMECLCLQCGISNYLELEGHTLETPRSGEDKILANIFCDACGGPLLVRGRAGDEPCYPIG